MLLMSLLLLSGCGRKMKYEYEGCSANIAYRSLNDKFDFVYEDTRLNIYDNGTWSIDEKLFLFIRLKTDKGTYTVKDGVYTFEGFEYGMKATGKKTEDGGFEIYFADSFDGTTTVATLHFVGN